MTQSNNGLATRSIDVKGRAVEVRALKETQLLFLAREAQLCTRVDVDNARKLVAVTRIMDILETAIVQPGDLDYVTDLNIKGELELGDLFGVLSAFNDADPEKPKVRRGRPRKTAV